MVAYETIGCYFCEAHKIQTIGAVSRSCASLCYALRHTVLLRLFGGRCAIKTLCSSNLKGDLNLPDLHLVAVARRFTVGIITARRSSCRCTCVCTLGPALLRERRQSGWQLSLFKAALMARQCLLPLGRGDWLWLLATDDRPAAARIRSAITFLSIKRRQEHFCLCELSISGMAVTAAACVCRKMIVSSAQKRPERKTVSPAITATEASIWHIRPIRKLSQLNTSAVESPPSIFDAVAWQALNTAH